MPLRDDYDSFFFLGSGGIREQFRPPRASVELAANLITFLVSTSPAGNAPFPFPCPVSRSAIRAEAPRRRLSSQSCPQVASAHDFGVHELLLDCTSILPR